jgi:hypothetical protein
MPDIERAPVFSAKLDGLLESDMTLDAIDSVSYRGLTNQKQIRKKVGDAHRINGIDRQVSTEIQSEG